MALACHDLTYCVPEMLSFQDTVQKLIEGMNKHASKIESAKLKALGQRNRSLRIFLVSLSVKQNFCSG
jgi:hypothetical protein